ncbi:aminotransferase class I/II-fold pyridoxal phosphate-dependent enzyme [Candidatus Uhrbacteria bacterium]|nr:aminotransferase class I/II-fold pyridoxal phosphate-dependent enzyme [Candidatus Uhrbacteria bacterium]
MQKLQNSDPEIYEILKAEEDRQLKGMTLIPSENHTSKEVLEALTSVLSDKYAEGYPGKRYYAGNEYADKLETLVQDRAKRLFGVPYANVQPYSGSPANLVIFSALLEVGDKIMGLNLLDGGHLTHGWKFSMTSKFWQSVPYHMTSEGAIDMEEVRRLAREEKPKIIICGGTAIPRAIPFKEFAEIADEVGAYLLADVSHIAGLIAGGAHESPVPYAHLVMTTTHKTLRGPRGAMIMVTDKGLAKDEELPEKIDKALIPGLQGGPHLNTIAGIGVALSEDAKPEFKEYASRVVANAKTLADELKEKGFELVSGGTDNHLILIDLTNTGVGRGAFFHEGLERIGIYTNKNTVPGDLSSPFYPSGLRIGTPAVTTRGMGEAEMKQIAEWIYRFASHIKDIKLPEDKAERKQVIKDFRVSLKSDGFYDELRAEVESMCEKFRVPGV